MWLVNKTLFGFLVLGTRRIYMLLMKSISVFQ